MKKIKNYQKIMAVLTLFSLLFILSLAFLMKAGGGCYTVGKIDGQIHDQAQQISQCMLVEKNPDFPQLPDFLVPVVLAFSCAVFLLVLLIKENYNYGYLNHTLISLCVRMNN